MRAPGAVGGMDKGGGSWSGVCHSMPVQRYGRRAVCPWAPLYACVLPKGLQPASTHHPWRCPLFNSQLLPAGDPARRPAAAAAHRGGAAPGAGCDDGGGLCAQ